MQGQKLATQLRMPIPREIMPEVYCSRMLNEGAAEIERLLVEIHNRDRIIGQLRKYRTCRVRG
jgi:hypothetical protein